MSEKKERIWELDALRGLCLLGMIAVHLCFDLQVFGGLYFPIPAWFRLMQEYGHILFILISGICATLATRTVRRGLIVFGAGLLVSYPLQYGHLLPPERVEIRVCHSFPQSLHFHQALLFAKAVTIVGSNGRFLSDHSAAISGYCEARSLNPARTLLCEQYGQPVPFIVLLLTLASHSCPCLHFQIIFL